MLEPLKPLSALSALAAALLLAGCGALKPAAAPPYERPALPVPAALPATSATAPNPAVQPDWPALVTDEGSRELVRLALAHNRDLRSAALNVERAQAQLRIAEADRWPTLNAVAGASRAPNGSGNLANSFTAGLSVPAYELDLWGRVQSATAATESLLRGSQASQRAAELAVVTAVVAAQLNLVADEDLLALTRRTLVTREDSLRLTQLRARVGAVADGELRSTETLVAQSRAALAQVERQRALDENALALLLGQPLPAALKPVAAAHANDTASRLLARPWLAAPVAASASEVLLQRPDVMAAEEQLRSADANVAAARAALLPRISLSASGGFANGDLLKLLRPGSLAFSLSAQAAAALFDSGRNQANVELAGVNRRLAVTAYEKALQTAFREAADALVSLDTWVRQGQALGEQLVAERERDRLVRMRFDAGAASALELLDSQRSLFATEQAVIQLRLAELQNRLGLYKALGGWPVAAK